MSPPSKPDDSDDIFGDDEPKPNPRYKPVGVNLHIAIQEIHKLNAICSAAIRLLFCANLAGQPAALAAREKLQRKISDYLHPPN